MLISTFRYAGLAALALAAGMTAHSQVPDTCLGFVKAIELSTSNDPAITTSQARKREALANAKEARSLYQPQISAFARTGLGDVGLIDSAIQNQVGLSASQRVIDFGDAKLARRAARFGVDASRYDIRFAEQQAGARVSSAILDILETREAIAFTADRQRFFRDQLEAIESLLAAGGATISDRAEVAAELANAQAFLLDLQFQEEQAETIFLIETGVAPNLCAEPIVSAEFDSLSNDIQGIETIVGRTLNGAPELQGLEARADGLAAQSERERRARLPIISIVGSAAYSSVGSAGNFQLQERVGLDVSVPVFTGSALIARSRRASARQAAAKSEVAERRRELEQEARISYRRALSLEAQIITAREVEARNRELLKFAQIEYEAGTRTLPNLVDVRITYEEAGLRRIGVKYAQKRERLRLLSVTGSLP